MTPFTLLVDSSTGDVDVSRGLRFTTTLAQYVAQRLFDNLSFFLNEWFLNLNEGIPYFEQIIGQKPDLPLIDTLYRRAILATAGVGSISNLQLSFDRATRALSVRFEAALVDGTTITEADTGRPFVVTLG